MVRMQAKREENERMRDGVPKWGRNGLWRELHLLLRGARWREERAAQRGNRETWKIRSWSRTSRSSPPPFQQPTYTDLLSIRFFFTLYSQLSVVSAHVTESQLFSPSTQPNSPLADIPFAIGRRFRGDISELLPLEETQTVNASTGLLCDTVEVENTVCFSLQTDVLSVSNAPRYPRPRRD